MKMKKFKLSLSSFLTVGLITLGAMSISSYTFSVESNQGTNQSYIIFDNGEVSTIRSYYPLDGGLKLIDADHLFLLPAQLAYASANYLIDKSGEIYTVDTHGFLYRKEFYYTDSKIKFFGGNYFITKKGQLHIIKNDGIIFNQYGVGTRKDDITKLKVAGGNYFITKSKKLFVITDNGYYFDKTDSMDFKINDIKIKGNNYLITNDGVVYTFGTEFLKKEDENGTLTQEPLLDEAGNKQYFAVVYKYDAVAYKTIAKVGGNYFFDTEHNIHTIANNGVFDRGIESRKLKVSLKEDRDRSSEYPVHLGNNYFSYDDGSLYMVDRDGYYYFLKKLVRRVGATSFESKFNIEKKNN